MSLTDAKYFLKERHRERQRGFYTCMNINDVDCIGQFVAGDPICPQPRPEQTRLMTHSSPSGGRPRVGSWRASLSFSSQSPGALSGPTSASAATSNIHPLHFTQPWGRGANYKTKWRRVLSKWWECLMFPCVMLESGSGRMRKITKPLIT